MTEDTVAHRTLGALLSSMDVWDRESEGKPDPSPKVALRLLRKYAQDVYDLHEHELERAKRQEKRRYKVHTLDCGAAFRLDNWAQIDNDERGEQVTTIVTIVFVVDDYAIDTAVLKRELKEYMETHFLLPERNTAAYSPTGGWYRQHTDIHFLGHNIAQAVSEVHLDC